ncbi:MAG: metallo-beta-lactamase, partial [Rhizorhabdus sp.]
MKNILRTTIGLIAACIAAPAVAGDVDDPLLRPIAPDFAAKWLRPEAPVNIYANVYLVGFGGLNVGLIRTDAGLVLIDGAVPQGVKVIEDNIRALGFSLSDVKLILSTEPHYDHAGGIAALARDTGATVVASAAAAPVLMRGRSGPEDPQMAWLESFPAMKKVRVVRDGEAVRLGKTVITARATPGHTPGSMSWTLRPCDKGSCLNIVFASSLNPIAA